MSFESFPVSSIVDLFINWGWCEWLMVYRFLLIKVSDSSLRYGKKNLIERDVAFQDTHAHSRESRPG